MDVCKPFKINTIHTAPTTVAIEREKKKALINNGKYR